MKHSRKSIVVSIDVETKNIIDHVYNSHSTISFHPSKEWGDSIAFTWNLSMVDGEQDYDNAFCINEIRNTLKVVKNGKYSTMYFDDMDSKPLKYRDIKNGKLA